jgi:glycosyltransferase involved in cell wall biosynthesis
LGAQSETKRVFIFLDTMPQRQGSGASLRFYSNVQAYLDLGFDVEVIQIGTEADGSQPSQDLSLARFSRVFEPASRPSIIGKLMFRAGIPHRSAVEYFVPRHRAVFREVEKRTRQSPKAIFHLEGEMMASILPWLARSVDAIWSLHDLPSTVSAATTKIACEAGSRSPTVAERRELRFARSVERLMARSASLILTIADHDRERLRSEWGCRAVEYLPLSIPGDGGETKGNDWLRDGRLRLLHLGSVSHLPSYRSLEFLFERVFPALPAQVLERIGLDVVGRLDRENDRAKRILDLAQPYSNVVFHGFVDDVVPFYKSSDLQVVASTDASGLRTRTIESFAHGLPVLSTTVGARGIANLKAGEHLLLADTSEEFAGQLERLTKNRDTLARLSQNGRLFYCQNQSRKAVATTLNGYLQQYLGRN